MGAPLESAPWTALEYRGFGKDGIDRPGTELSADKEGILFTFRPGVSRVFSPTQARMLASNLTTAADEAEKRGAQDWMGL